MWPAGGALDGSMLVALAFSGMHNVRENMKSILLASASIVALAGAAAAQDAMTPTISFGGNATVGYNDEIENGFYWETNLTVRMNQELNDGLMAGVTFTLNIDDGEEGNDDDFADGGAVSVDSDIVVSLTMAGMGGLFFGDTSFAAQTQWDGAGAMASDGFSEQDGETVIRGDFMVADISASVSYVVADEEGDSADDLDQLSLGASGDVGRFTFSVAYQDESDAVPIVVTDTEDAGGVYSYDPVDSDFNPDQIFGVSAGTTFGGADVTLAYAQNMTDDTSSIGVEAAYPFGPVTLTGSVVFEQDDDDTNEDVSYKVQADYASGPVAVSAFYESERGVEDFGVEASYTVNDRLALYAGYIDSTEGYVGAEYELSDTSEIIVSYAEQDEEGAREYKQGTTIALSLEF